jgi:hypothetical protein
LPPELTFDGLTPKDQQALFKTYDINVKAIQSEDSSFLELMRHAALMDPDVITKPVLYEIYNKKVRPFFDEPKQTQFENAVKSTSLMAMEDDSPDISMHRSIQLILLLKIADQVDTIKLFLTNLFSYCSESYLSDPVAYRNFSYLLRNINKEALFYRYISTSERIIIQGMYDVANQYIEAKEIDQGIYFLSQAIGKKEPNQNQDLYVEIEQKLINVLEQHFALKWVDEGWLVNLLDSLSRQSRNKVVDVFLRKEAILTSTDRYFDLDYYYPTVRSLANAIIKIYAELEQKSNADKEYLAKAHHILGRAYRENAEGAHTSITRLQGAIKAKKGTISKQQAVIKQRSKWANEVGIPAQITQLKNEIENIQAKVDELKQKFPSDYAWALDSLKQSYLLREELGQQHSKPALHTGIQIMRLHELQAVSNAPGLNIPAIAKDIVNCSKRLEKNYENDVNYCKELAQAAEASSFSTPGNNLKRNCIQQSNLPANYFLGKKQNSEKRIRLSNNNIPPRSFSTTSYTNTKNASSSNLPILKRK